ncbi:MAG: ferrous iron transport protein B, partial [Methylococcales bacterium]
RQQVGNWPGVTVERKSGDFQFKNCHFEVVDLPGTYSLDVSDDSVSLDEQIARDYVANHEADLIVNIVDAANIERNLYLTAQLIEMKVPVLVALNMMDTAEQRGMRIDIRQLSKQIGCAVIPIVASKKKGIEFLKEAILSLAQNQNTPLIDIPYSDPFESAVNEVIALLEKSEVQSNRDRRWLAIKLLEADSLARRSVDRKIEDQVSAIRKYSEEALDDDIDIAAADGRYTFINRIVRASVCKASEVKRSTSDRIDRIVLNRALGIPIFLLIMYSMFMLTINVGSAFIDFFDQFAGAFLVDGFGHLLAKIQSPDWLTLFLAQGVGGGIRVVATFIPVIGFLYLFLSVLEDSGYMARAAFVMDRFMRLIGLPGKAFVPLIVG